MSRAGLIARLEAHVQEEIAAQRRLQERIDEQERALTERDLETLASALAALTEELGSEPRRASDRRELLDALAESWGAVRGTLTIGSTAERAGEGGRRLERMRVELAKVVRGVRGSTRRLLTLARYNHSLFQELIAVYSRGLGARSGMTDGNLVNAEA